MNYQFTISPGTKKVNPRKPVVNEEISVLSFAPFTPTVKIFFDQVIVGSSSTQKLLITNSSDKKLAVWVQNLPPSELGVTLSWDHTIISPNTEALLEIHWSPTAETAIRHILEFEDDRNLRKDVAVIFKSVLPPKKKLKNGKNKPSLFMERPTLPTSRILSSRSRLQNPKPAKKLTPKSNKSKSTSQKLQISHAENKENFNPFENSSPVIFNEREVFSTCRNATFDINTNFCEDDFRRDTFVVKNSNLNRKLSANISNDSLEAMPLSNNRLTMNFEKSPGIKDLKFKLESSLFSFTPVKTNYSNFSPRTHSTERKPIELLELEENKLNISSETYVKGNLSSDTFILKNNLSTETYTKDLSVGKFEMFELSPGVCELQPRKRQLKIEDAISPPKKARLTFKPNMIISKTNFKQNCRTAFECVDPFLSGTIYHDNEWVEEQETIFKKWLNALLTPPSELVSNTDGPKVDAAKLWQQCKNAPISMAPSKELISNRYHTNNRLDSLRKSAVTLFRSDAIRTTLSKAVETVDKNKITMRTDRDIHLDLNLQSHLMTLLLSYNPLWLRIGLETIYDLTIPLNSNSDVMGLSNFIFQRFIRDPYLLKKYKHIHSEKYCVEIKKFVLKKFLILVYFLDVAKTKVLIAHDPCLFCKNAPIKESREILLKFSSELLSAATGDITRYLKFTGYILLHKQKYIHEFDYSVRHLGTDLRDGVRLTKVAEIILVKSGLTDFLRVPAISKLQKIHNMKVVFDNLAKENFKIVGDISPIDIVEGHHEKTLSLLWQIIYKFRAPILVKASTTIQTWWRSLSIVIKRRILYKKYLARRRAVNKIQTWYLRLKVAINIKKYALKLRRTLQQQAYLKKIVKIQAYVRMRIQSRQYKKIRRGIVLLQSCVRGFITRQSLRYKIYATIRLQSYFRMVIVRNNYLRLQAAALVLQNRWRANTVMKIERDKFQCKKVAAITIQNALRAHWAMVSARERFLSIKSAAIVLQTQYRSYKLMKNELERFIKLKKACIVIQRRWRANLTMKIDRKYYLTLRKATIAIQIHFKANQLMKVEYERFAVLKHFCLIVQRKWRAILALKNEMKSFLALKKAASVIQVRFRANQLMKLERERFIKLRKACFVIEKRWLANLAMKRTRESYLTLKKATTILQIRFRANQLMKGEHERFIQLKKSCLIIQKRWLANVAMKRERYNYLTLKKASTVLQIRFRANQQMKVEHKLFLELKRACIVIQRRYRANLAMKSERGNYLELKKATVTIQIRFRANQLMMVERTRFLELKQACLTIQSRWLANLAMKNDIKRFLALKKAAGVIQIQFQANQIMKFERRQFLKLKKSVITIQTVWRGYLEMKTIEAQFLSQKNAAVILQRRFTAWALMKKEFERFQNLKRACIIVQRVFRANRSTEIQRSEYLMVKTSTVVIQRRYRAKLQMKIQRQNFQTLKKTTVFLQSVWRANHAMKIDRKNFLNLKKATVTIQIRFRAYRLMKIERQRFLTLKKTIRLVQTVLRAKWIMKIERKRFLSLREATVLSQNKFRANRAMKIERLKFLLLKTSAVIIQRRLRAQLLMKSEREEFLKLRQAVIVVQNRFRAKKTMEAELERFRRFKKAAIKIQNFMRSIWKMRVLRKKYLATRQAAIVIQRGFRSKFLTAQGKEFLIDLRKKHRAAIKIQTIWRGYLTRKLHPEVALIRKNIELANLEAVPFNTLGQRTERAMQLLCSDTASTSHLIYFLKDLDFITRRCPVTCIKLSETMPKILMKFVISTNRSIPDMTACMYATSILINLRKYHLTSTTVWLPCSLNNIIVAMHHYCDKENILFSYLSTFIWLLAQNENHVTVMHRLPNFTQRIHLMKTNCLRKKKMLLRQQYQFKSYFMSYTDLPLPSLIPDWGLDLPNNPRTFTNSLHALDCLLNVLNIE